MHGYVEEVKRDDLEARLSAAVRRVGASAVFRPGGDGPAARALLEIAVAEAVELVEALAEADGT